MVYFTSLLGRPARESFTAAATIELGLEMTEGTRLGG